MNNNNPRQGIGKGLFLVAVKWLFLTAAISLSAHWLEGIHIGDFYSALAAAGVLGLLNVFVRPALLILMLPINVLSVGLFTFIINAMMLKLASFIVPDFSVEGFAPAFLGALLISFINWLLNLLVGNNNFIIVKGKWR